MMTQPSERARRLFAAAARLQFPGTPQLWELAERKGPWDRVVIQLMAWAEAGLSTEAAEAEAAATLKARDEYWDAEVLARRSTLPKSSNPADAARRAANTAALLASLKGVQKND